MRIGLRLSGGVGLMLCCLWGAWAAQAAEPLRCADVFQDNMVLQRDMDLPIWGRGNPGDKVTVEFAGQSVTATVAADKTWRATLMPLKAISAPAEMTISDGPRTIVIRNVVVGEVWLCSGQSNMALAVKDCNDAKAVAANANDPLIRVYGRNWEPATPQTVEAFTGVGYFFARDLRQRLNVPVGILSKSVGGTAIQPWLSWEGAQDAATPLLRAYVADTIKEKELERKDPVAYKKNIEDRWRQANEGKMAWIDQLLSQNLGEKYKWYEPATPVGDWRPLTVPMPDAASGWGLLSTFWVRRDVDLPPAMAGKDLLLHMGGIDDADITYVNGVKVGQTWYNVKDFWKIPREYKIPADLVKTGHVTIVVRAPNIYGVAGLFGKPEDWALTTSDGTQTLPLAGSEWCFRVDNEIDPGTQPRVRAAGDFGVLYQSLIHPLATYGLRGVLWYQGESNANEPALYAEMFPALIASWRKAWNQKELPFYFVQLAAYTGPQITPIERFSWAALREAQMSGLNLPDTGVVVTTDIGDAGDIHPRNKQEVGRRLALLAQAKTYGQKVEYSGPVYKALKSKDGRIKVMFDHAKELQGQLRGFAIAGADKVFHQAQAKIEGNAVVVWSADVGQPVAVRYNWASNPIGVLRNGAGQPASQFRTDDWPEAEVSFSDHLPAQ